MMVGLAMATMVESTMIMKKPIIIAHSGFHGFCECAELRVMRSQRWAPEAGPDGARRPPPGVRGVAVVIHPTSFRSRRTCPAPFPPDRPALADRPQPGHPAARPPQTSSLHYPRRGNGPAGKDPPGTDNAPGGGAGTLA